jgi:hypothetical protein
MPASVIPERFRPVPTALDARVTMNGRYASPGAMKMQSGLFYDNAFHASNTSTIAINGAIVELVPMYFNSTVTIDQIGLAVTVAGGNGKILIYNTDADNLPTTLFYESGSLGLSTGFRSESPSGGLTIPAGSYWMGVWLQIPVTFRAGNVGSMCNLGLSAGNDNTYNTKIRRSLTYAGSAPNPWTFVSSELTTGNPLLVRWRVA